MTSLRATYAGKELLVTGVTGFLGKVWVAMLLDHLDEIGRLHLVIRGKKSRPGRDRFIRSVERSPAYRTLRHKHGAGLHAFLDDKVTVHEGDVSEPNAGLSEATLAGIAPRLAAVVHFAGLTDFQPDPLSAFATNVTGALNAADVAARLPVPRLVHISTSFVAGCVSGRIAEEVTPRVSPNGRTFDPREELRIGVELSQALELRSERVDAVTDRAQALGWPNIYTFSKALAEHLLTERKDVRSTFVRPAIVESAMSYPFPGWNEGMNTSGPIVWLMSTWFRRLPARPDNHFDVVPVDTVARGTTVAVGEALRDVAAPVYHLASSATNPLTFARAIDLNALAYRRRYSRTRSTDLERLVKRHFDGVVGDPERDPFPSMAMLRNGARELSKLLDDVDLKKLLSADFYERRGAELEKKRKSALTTARNADRNLKRIEEMLRLYRPFIHDHDYVFVTDAVLKATAALVPEERAAFGFDIDALCWRRYWIEVHVPGLEKWSLPLLRNEKPDEDPPFEHALGAAYAAPSAGPSSAGTLPERREMTLERT
jgi:long-chain acyl-CoA synthetase